MSGRHFKTAIGFKSAIRVGFCIDWTFLVHQLWLAIYMHTLTHSNSHHSNNLKSSRMRADSGASDGSFTNRPILLISSLKSTK